jgi:hypothetical protein
VPCREIITSSPSSAISRSFERLLWDSGTVSTPSVHASVDSGVSSEGIGRRTPHLRERLLPILGERRCVRELAVLPPIPKDSALFVDTQNSALRALERCVQFVHQPTRGYHRLPHLDSVDTRSAN